MAGRGTDIVLGGNPEYMARTKIKGILSEEIAAKADGYDETDDEEINNARKLYKEYLTRAKEEIKDDNEKVLQAGGLSIIGTERHESRRIDNQLRGRAGRQGDPGSSRFYISLDDDLMRLFAGDKVKSLVSTLGLPEDEALQHNMLTKTIETAQGRVEGRNFNIRKHVLQYDNVMNKQREVIYSERRKVLMGEDLREHVMSMVNEQIATLISKYAADKYPENWDLTGYEDALTGLFGPRIKLNIDNIESLDLAKLTEVSRSLAEKIYKMKEDEFGEEQFREVERIVLLKTVDTKWMDHIDAMDELRQGIGLRAMGNEDPVRAYQQEGFDMFQEMINMIQEDTVKFLYRVRPQEKLQRTKVARELGTNLNGESSKPKTVVKGEKIGRNDPCPCGSGKKYKKCCGQNS
jgi:preprotein translocase subunit SecA